MNERVTSAEVQGNGQPCDSVCIQTNQIYDSCKEKDCLTDLNLLFTRCDQELINRAINVKCRKSEIIWVYTDVEAVPFNKGFFTVDIKYFFKITLDVFTGVSTPTQVEALATFDKKVILFGSEGNARIFSSKYRPDESDTQLVTKTNLPKATVEVVDPICLGAKLVEKCNCCCVDPCNIPQFICGCFHDELVSCDDNKAVQVSLGLFTIVRLERPSQLLIPSYDFCIPQKECVSASDDDPCELFDKISFPFDEFFPPQRENFDDCDTDYRSHCCK